MALYQNGQMLTCPNCGNTENWSNVRMFTTPSGGQMSADCRGCGTHVDQTTSR